MAIEASTKANIVNDFDDDDDDGPVVFKRSNTAAKQNQVNSEGKKPSSSTANGQNANTQKGKTTVPFSKASPMRSPPPSLKASSSSAKGSPVKSPVLTSKTPSPLDDRLKQSPQPNASSLDKKEDGSVSNGLENDDEDFEDHKPLSARLKGNNNNANRGPSAPKADTSPISRINVKSAFDDSDDEAPLSSRFPKSCGGTSGGKHSDPDEKKPLTSKLQQNGSTTLDKRQKSSFGSIKRPLDKVATMYAVMLETDYMQKPKFKENFWTDWRKLLGKNHVIQNLTDCDFKPIYDWHQQQKEIKKQMNSEEKKAVREEKMKQEEKYMWAIVDGVKEKVGNFRVEPPGLFRGRGEHPKMGKLKKRIRPSDITINIGEDAPIPECPIPGESWKEVKHDNTVTWLAFWNDPINPKEFKYVFLAASSSLKGQSDKEKYEKARKLKDYIESIRASYTKDFTSKDVSRRQIAVATYLIDKLALRAGNEKDDDEADTVGCCTLKVGNVECIPPNKLKFDFLGKDSIQYVNTVEVELPVYKAIGQFQTGKKQNDDLFDKLDTAKLNAHLKELMPGLTAKVFRTYNASITLDEMLSKETKEGDVAEKIVVYQTANKEVAIICNHQRSVSKSHGAQMTRLTEKIEELKGVLKDLKIDLDRARKGKPPLKDSDGKRKRNLTPEAIERKIAQTDVKIEKMERDMKTKEDLKTVALGTSKINYLDPRITVAWCKRHEVPIEKIFNKSLLAKFAWAMDVDPEFRF